MVSIHKVPVIVFLIIRVICFIYRFKREVLASLANLFLEDRYSKAQEFITQNAFKVAKKLFKYTASIK